MSMYVMLLIGFALLLKGASWFVDSASAIARALHVPSLIIGLTIVAMGTSAPEVAVSVSAGISGSSEIALSNVVGSNIFNVLMVIGLSALLRPAPVEEAILRRDLYWNIGASLLVLLLLYNTVLGRLDGLILLLALVVYMGILLRSALRERKRTDAQSEDVTFTASEVAKKMVWLVVGLSAVVLGGDMVVDSAVDIAAAWGMSETVIGLTIVAVGTSLPELVTSVMAAYKGDSSLAIGNVLGSNIFNLLFILGLTCVVSPISAMAGSLVDVGIVCAVAFLTLLFCKTGKVVERREALVCVLLYVVYTVWLLLR